MKLNTLNLILSLLVIIFFMCGCIQNTSNQNEIKIADDNDLLFSIKTDKFILNSTSSSFNLTFTIKNIINKSVQILSEFRINTTITIQLIDLYNNNTYSNIHIDQFKEEYTTLKSGEIKDYKINLKNIKLIKTINNSKETFNYDMPGDYILKSYYKFADKKPLLKSNELKIKII